MPAVDPAAAAMKQHEVCSAVEAARLVPPPSSHQLPHPRRWPDSECRKRKRTSGVASTAQGAYREEEDDDVENDDDFEFRHS